MDLQVYSGEDLWVLLYAVIFGALLGLVYRVFWAVRAALMHGRVITFVLDILYFSLAGLFVFVFFMGYTDGQVRAYLLAGMAGGAALYRISADRLIGNALLVFGKLTGNVFRVAMAPMKKLCAICANMLQKERLLFKKLLKIPKNSRII